MRRYWFKPKRYGYGATPVTWEGWAMTLGAGFAVAGSIIAMNLWVDPGDTSAWLTWALFAAVVTFALVRISRSRTDGEWRWRWGNRTGMKQS